MFQEYYELGLSVIPVASNGKNPIIDGWSKYCEELPTQDLIDKWDKMKVNIGVACGPASGILVLDIDTDDKEILDLCPPSPVRRRGKKGECRFFKYNPNIPSTSIPQIDILSIGRQVLIPPSVHPDTKKPYVWITPDTLENFSVKDLPELDMSFLSKLSKKVSIEIPGRNNKLVDIVSSMRSRGEPEQEIINQIYEWDKNYHSPRLFLEAKEGFKGKSEDDAKRNAWKFVINVSKTLIENGTAVMSDTAPLLILDETKVIPVYQAQNFPRPTGIMGDLMELTEKYSEREMPNLALGGAIALMAVVCSNRFRFNDTWPNVFVLNLAPTGAGKSFPQRIIKKILDEKLSSDLIGYGNYRSSSALTKNLVSKRERLDIIDEVAGLFAQMKSGGLYQTEILDELCKLWSDSNTKFLAGEYSEKTDTSTCYNPCISIIGSSTISGIKNNLNKLMIEKGLMPRFLIFSHDSYGKIKDDYLDEKLLNKVTDNLKELIAKFPKRKSAVEVPTLHGPMYDPRNMAPIEKEAISYFNSLKREFASRMESGDHEASKHILSRGKEQIMKLSLLHAVSNGRKITLEDLKWAKEVFDISMHNSKAFIEESSVDNEHEKDVTQVFNFIIEKGEITHSKLQHRFRRIQSIRLKQIIQQLIEDSSIIPFERKHSTNNKTSKGYIAAKL